MLTLRLSIRKSNTSNKRIDFRENTIERKKDTPKSPPIASSVCGDDVAPLGRCVFIPRGAGPRVLYGMDADGEHIHIDDAASGEGCGLICPDCFGAIIAKKGDVMRSHFAHKSLVECVRSGETALHRLAKQIIFEDGKLRLPPVTLDHYREDGTLEVIRGAMDTSFTRVEVEPRQDGFQPDLIGIQDIHRDGRVFTHRLHIEILVTHSVDQEKLSLLRQNGESALEIDLSKVQRSITRSELSVLLLASAPRRWLYHKVVSVKQAAIDKALFRQSEASMGKLRRKQEFADLKRKEFEDELNRPPSGADASVISMTVERRRLWDSLGYGWVIDGPAEDRYFDVEPDVWRSFVIEAISPRNTYEFPQEDEAYLAKRISLALRQLGWVKPEYAQDKVTTYLEDIGKHIYSPIREQVTALLRNAAKHDHPSKFGDHVFQLQKWRRRMKALL